MNYTSENRTKLVSRFLKFANQRLVSANACLGVKSYSDSISRSYYAMLDTATALLITKDILPKSHEGIIRMFSLHFIKTGILPKEYGKWFKRIE
ncbi:MAG: HEPN domain-containing protein [Candidatus Anammoxibacter sp.]